MVQEAKNYFKFIIIIIKNLRLVLVISIVLLIVFLVVSKIVHINKSNIVTEKGIQEAKYIELGGIKQYVQIRGENVDNPIIVFLHGGPGVPMTFLSYYYQRALEDDYTIVNWEQRGCGRTYYENIDNNKSQLSTENLINDLDELVDYLRFRFNKNKIIIMGHSWGTVLGTRYIKEKPEKVDMYIGISQIINFKDSKILAAEKSIELAKEKNDVDFVNEISRRLEKFKNDYENTSNIKGIDLDNYSKLVQLNLKYTMSGKEMGALKQSFLFMTSPDVNMKDFKWSFMGTEKLFDLEEPLMNSLFFDFDLNNEDANYEVPVYFISGDSDWTIPYVETENYYKRVQAPKKSMVIVKDAGHAVMLDNRDEFCKSIKNILKNEDSDV